MIKFLQKAGLAILALFAGKTVHSQIWIEQTGNDDPFEGATFYGQTHPTTADIDGDGDNDIISGICEEPWLSFFENEGNNSFNNVQGVQNPFENIDACSHPEFIDIDNDGDLDLVVGTYDADKYSILKLYINENGEFTEEVDNNPFTGITAYYDAHPSFSDIDDDGDMDLILGSYNNLALYRNDGSNGFQPSPLSPEVFGSLEFESYVTPSFADIDMDGDEDAIFGNKYGDLKFFRKDGPDEFIELTGIENHFSEFDLFIAPSPHFFDYDGDTDPDLLIGDAQGNIKLYLNSTINTGVQTISNTEINVFPNPSSDIIRFEGAENAQFANIFSIEGKLVLSKPFFNGDKQVDIRDLESGQYLIRINSDDSVWTGKFIKN